MAGRRILYAALLIGAAVLHIAYGQFVTHLILLFLLILPLLSLILVLPAVFNSRADLTGGGDYAPGSKTSVSLKASCSSSVFAPLAWKIKVERTNLFAGEKPQITKLVFRGNAPTDSSFIPDTEHIGSVRCILRKAAICDPLGLFAIPVKKSGEIMIYVLPREEEPVPLPDLVGESATVTKPKPGGFSEEHEIRQYRPGDSINLIHWKLTMKMDEPMIREPQELLRKHIILSADIPGWIEAAESVFGIVLFLGKRLVESGVPFTIHFGRSIAYIRTEDELDDFIHEELARPLSHEDAVPTLEGSDTLVYRIIPRREVRK